jgi:acetolactate decarboxylase
MWKALRVPALAMACVVPWPLVAESGGGGTDTLHQISTLTALLQGDYDGRATSHELRAVGDFGLGTFDRLDGEMVALDGRHFRVGVDGRATRVRPDDRTPFAAVTAFRADESFRIEGPVSCSALGEAIRARFASEELVQAIKVTGEFSRLVTRSVPAQEKPYVPLAEALQDQVVFDFYSVEATMVGFWVPPVLSDVNVSGFHFHALSADETAGGHVLDCEALSVKVEIDATDGLDVRLGSSLKRSR